MAASKSLRTKSKKEARLRALRFEGELLQGMRQPTKKPPTVEALVDGYMTYQRAERRAKTTLAKYTRVGERVKHLAHELHRSTALGIDRAFLDEYRKRRSDDGRAEETIGDETVIIRQIVNFALSREMISRDPLAGLKIKQPKWKLQPCWTPEEVEKILAASDGKLRAIVVLLADSGMRIAELRWLTWDDADFVHNVIHVRPKDEWKLKTRDQRAFPMSPRVRTLLEQLPRHSRWIVTAGQSVKHPQGDGQIVAQSTLRSLKRLLKRLSLPGHLHTFRHAFISRSLLAGIPEAVVKEWVGHVDRDIIKRYTHVASQQSQHFMRCLAETPLSQSSQEFHDE